MPLHRPGSRVHHLGAAVTRILIAEANGPIAAFLVKGAVRYGLEATVTDDGRDALLLASSGEYDALVVDGRLPNLPSLTAVRHWEEPRLPIIVLDGDQRAADLAARFGVPLDDVLAKPFRFLQLVARVSGHLTPADSDDPSVMTIGRACLNLGSRELTLGRTRVALTRVEFALAAAFFRHPGRMLTDDELLFDQQARSGERRQVSPAALISAPNRNRRRRLTRTAAQSAAGW